MANIITATELNGIPEAEKGTAERKERQKKKGLQKRGSMTRNESADESEMELDAPHEAGDIFDCIAVESLKLKREIYIITRSYPTYSTL